RALLLRCPSLSSRSPGDGPRLFRRVLGALVDCGARAAWLPPAMKWLSDANTLRAAAAEAGDGGRDLLARHVVRDGGRTWLHTHGMAQFALPDLECRIDAAREDVAARLIDHAASYLIGGGDAPGAVLVAPDSGHETICFS